MLVLFIVTSPVWNIYILHHTPPPFSGTFCHDNVLLGYWGWDLNLYCRCCLWFLSNCDQYSPLMTNKSEFTKIWIVLKETSLNWFFLIYLKMKRVLYFRENCIKDKIYSCYPWKTTGHYWVSYKSVGTCNRSMTSLSTAMLPRVLWKKTVSKSFLSTLLIGSNVSRSLLSLTLLAVWLPLWLWCL